MEEEKVFEEEGALETQAVKETEATAKNVLSNLVSSLSRVSWVL